MLQLIHLVLVLLLWYIRVDTSGILSCSKHLTDILLVEVSVISFDKGFPVLLAVTEDVSTEGAADLFSDTYEGFVYVFSPFCYLMIFTFFFPRKQHSKICCYLQYFLCFPFICSHLLLAFFMCKNFSIVFYKLIEYLLSLAKENN